MPTYYTPTVEDLVWGLEMEYLNQYDYWAGIIFNETVTISLIKGLIYQSKLRIKHLDEDDIIELGWDNRQIGAFRLKHYEDGIEIFEVRNDRLKTIYQGICKNKAELKRLMNNLSITK